VDSPRRRIWSKLAIALRVALAMVFILAAVGKLTAPSGFYRFLEPITWLSFLHPNLIRWVAIGTELLLSVLILVPRTWKIGAAGSVGFLVLFTTLLMISSYTGSETPCGCFGELLPEMDIDSSIFRNIILIIVATLLIGQAHAGKNLTEI
jgi:uncharacterized membrane protein YphA (DoxX/SURF4 family)